MQTHHTGCDSSGRVIGPPQKPLSENKQHSEETDIHAPGGIRTRDPLKRVAGDPRLRSSSHRNRIYRLLTHARFEDIIRDLSERQTLNSSSGWLDAPQFVNTVISRKILLKT
jgi:hypothetical protein